MKNVWTLAWKDIKLFMADKRAMIISFAVPISIASFFALILGGNTDPNAEPEKIKFLLVDLDQSAITKAIVSDLGKSKQVLPVPSPVESAREQVRTGKATVAVIFPKGFGDQARQALFAGDVPKLSMLFDPSKKFDMQIVQGAFMQSAMGQISKGAFSGTGAQDTLTKWRDSVSDPTQRSAIDTLMRDFKSVGTPDGESGAAMRTPFTIEETPMMAEGSTNDEVAGSRAHIFAGMAMQGILFFAIESAMAMMRDKRTGVWRRLRAAPLSRMSIIFGRLLSATILSSLIGLGVYLFGFLVMGVRVNGSWPGFAVVLLASSIMTAAFGLLIASLGRTEAQSRGFSTMAVLLMSMLGGAWFPTFLMPKFVQTISMAIPVRWAVDGFDSVTWRGLDFGSVVVPIAALIGFSLLFCGVAVTRFKWDE